MMLSISPQTLLRPVRGWADIFLRRRHPATFGRTAIRLIAPLLPAQTGDYLILMASLPIAGFLPDWPSGWLDRIMAPLAYARG